MDQESGAGRVAESEASEMLARILKAVEKDDRRNWMEVTTAILLSLTTMASAWCAYQATLWSGVQTYQLVAANEAAREVAENSIALHQRRGFDATMFMFYTGARSAGDTNQEQFLYRRFRPPMRKALDAWLATNPYTNPEAPPHPFAMSDYVLPEEGQARKQRELAGAMLAEAQKSNHTSDSYVLLTVLFASVLFAGGIGGTFRSQRLRLILDSLALTLFVVTTISLAMLPICKE